jgi:hypothetical protein
VFCGKPNNTLVFTVTGKACGTPFMFWRSRAGLWRNQHGLIVVSGIGLNILPRMVFVRLQVCHLRKLAGEPGHDADSNLASLCAWHHFRIDEKLHRLTRELRKDRERPMLEAA